MIGSCLKTHREQMGMGDGPAAKKVLASEYLEQQTRLAAEAAEALKATAVKVRLHAGASFEDARAAVAAAGSHACLAAGRPMPRSFQIFPKKTVKRKICGAGWLRLSQASA